MKYFKDIFCCKTRHLFENLLLRSCDFTPYFFSVAELETGCRDLGVSSCKWIPDSMCSYQGVQIQCPSKCGLCEGSARKGLEKMTDLELIMEEEFLQVQYKDDDLNDVDNSTTTTSQQTSDRILYLFFSAF